MKIIQDESDTISKRIHITLWIIVFCLTTLIIWAYYAQIDEIISGVAKVIPNTRTQVIQNLEGGILSDILVQEGDWVEKDQILLKIDDTSFKSSLLENRNQYLSLLAKILRLHAESEGKGFSAKTALQIIPQSNLMIQTPLSEHDTKQLSIFLSDEAALFHSRKKALQSEIDILVRQLDQRKQQVVETKNQIQALQKSYELAEQELQISKPLAEQGVVSTIDILKLKRESNELNRKLNATQLSLPRLQSAIEEMNKRIKDSRINFKTDALAEYNQEKILFMRMNESMPALEDKVNRADIRSPVKGIIQQVLVSTIGEVIHPGKDLIKIVPTQELLMIEGRIHPKDIGFLKKNMPATIKFTAYEYTRFGSMNAQLAHISADTILDDRGGTYYKILLTTENNYLETQTASLPIIPGMQGRVDIIIGKRTILSYLLTPIFMLTSRF